MSSALMEIMAVLQEMRQRLEDVCTRLEDVCAAERREEAPPVEVWFTGDRFDFFVDRLRGRLAAEGAFATTDEVARILVNANARALAARFDENALLPRRRGPRATRDLDPVVGQLIEDWERKVGPGSFTADWTLKSRQAVTHAAQFVCDAVEFIDSTRLREVPKIIERVRAKRKAARANFPD